MLYEVITGEPELVDTSREPRLSRIFSNKVIKRYPAFHEFYGMEEAIESIVAYFRHSAQGLEEKKQILYLLGPVGGGKSSLAERLKHLMEYVPRITSYNVCYTKLLREIEAPLFESVMAYTKDNQTRASEVLGRNSYNFV